MQSKAAGSQITGQKLSPKVSAISAAACQYIPASATVSSNNIVLGPGAGTYIGMLIGVVPTNMSSLMVAAAAASGLSGRDIKKLCDAVSFGICQTLLSTAKSQGTVVGGGPEAGQGTIAALVPNALQGLIMAQLAGKQIMGSKTMSLVKAMATGICNHIMQNGKVITTCVGAAAGPPAGPVSIPGAPGPGKLI